MWDFLDIELEAVDWLMLRTERRWMKSLEDVGGYLRSPVTR